MTAIYFKHRRLKSLFIVTVFLVISSIVVLRTVSFKGLRVSDSSIGSPKFVNSSMRKFCFGNEKLCLRLIAELNFTLSSKHYAGLRRIPPLFDINNQPCVSKILPSTELEINGGCVRTLTRSHESLIADKRECVNLSVADEVTPICLHNTTIDKYISVYLKQSGTWEPLLLFSIFRLLKQTKGSAFLDLGCNIGAFTLAAAKTNAQVVAVDPLLENLEALSKSLHVGNLFDRVTLVWNAVSQTRSTVTLQKYTGNVGGTAINMESSSDIRDSVNTIKLDDLQEFFLGKPTFIKMDVETQELNTLLGGELFFQTIDVRVVLLEYNWHKDKMSGIQIFTFMENHGFRPYADARGHEPLVIEERRRWPGEVFFLKQEHFQDFLKHV